MPYSQRAKAWITQFYLQITPCLPFLRGVHQMLPPQQLRQRTSNCSSLLIYRPRKNERLSWPSWLTYSGWFTHISGHPSATGRAQDSESTPTNVLALDELSRPQRAGGEGYRPEEQRSNEQEGKLGERSERRRRQGGRKTCVSS